MELKCKIKNVEYPIMQGCTFTDCYNETLDSGIICIDQVPLIKGLKPYDDVYIYDADTDFDGYYAKGDMIAITAKMPSPEIVDTGSYESDRTISFYSTDTDPIDGKKWIIQHGDVNGHYSFSGSIFDIFYHAYSDFQSKSEREANSPIRDFGIKMDVSYKSRSTSGSVTMRLLSAYDTANEARAANIDPYGGDALYLFYQDTTTDPDTGETTVIETMKIPCQLDTASNTLSFPDYLDTFGNKTGVSITGVYLNSSWSITYSVKKAYSSAITLKGMSEFNLSASATARLSYSLFGNDIEASGIVTQNKSDDTYTFVFKNPIKSSETMTFTATRVDGTDDYSFSYVSSFGESGSDPSFFGFAILEGISSLMIESQGYSELPSKFFKHMLVDSFTKQRLNLGNSFSDSSVLYKYQINLMSETKRLEKVILPNVSITQPLDSAKKRTCWEYMSMLVDLYSPKYKKASGGSEGRWSYVEKYALGDSEYEYLNGKNGIVTDLKSIFSEVYCPEMSLTNPSLKDMLSQIMITKDIIPIVFNDVIYGLDIGKTEYPDFDRSGVNFDIGSMSSSNYATDARRSYSGALSQEKSAHMIEYMGFRCPNSPFLTLADMVLETRFPIYKVNSIKLCYYKKFTLTAEDESTVSKTFMCKYDITPLVLQNVVRNSLSTNWKSYYKEETGKIDYSGIEGTTYEEKLASIAKYKLCTVGYDIGSNTISGWGTSYSYLSFLWLKTSKTYIENIVELLEDVDPKGSEAFESELRKVKDGKSYAIGYTHGVNGIIPFSGEGVDSTNIANKLKSIVFEMDYDAMYNGAVMHSKDWCDADDIVTADNCSSSLSILETDGLFEKEKMNRMSNETYKFTARYDDGEYSNVQQLSSYDPLTDSIIYTREYQIYDNAIFANYEAVHDYVMKNYFTSVWAKYRTYSLMSYNESVNRAENHREMILLSKDKQYYEDEGLVSKGGFGKFLSFLDYTEQSKTGVIDNDLKMNFGYFLVNGHKYLSDINSFACGNSMCFNIATYDNVSGGNKIDSMSATLTWAKALSGATIINNIANVVDVSTTLILGDTESSSYKEFTNNYKATQSWYQMVEDASDAFTEKVGAYICHLDEQSYYKDRITDYSDSAATVGGEKMMALPALPRSGTNDIDISDYVSESVGNVFTMNKDNKERIDFTYQFEYICEDSGDVMISPWAAKLNDMVGAYNKHAEELTINESINEIMSADFIASQENDYSITLTIVLSDDDLETIKNNEGSSLSLSNDTISGFLDREQQLLSYSGLWNEYEAYSVSNSVITFSDVIMPDKSQNAITAKVFMNFDAYNWEIKKTLFSSSSGNKIAIKHNAFNNNTITFSLDESASGDGKNYFVAKSAIPSDYLYLGTYYLITLLSSTQQTRYAYAKAAYDDWINCSIGSGDKLTTRVGVATESDEVIGTNMILVRSTKRLDSTLQYNSYDNGNLPSHLTDVTSLAKVTDFFNVDPESMRITVKAGKYQKACAGAKSMQYYYVKDGSKTISGVKTEYSTCYFVFGVNVDALPSINGIDIWKIGSSVYYSSGTDHYSFSDGSWSKKAWSGLDDVDFQGRYVWTDGENVYYSHGDDQLKLDGSAWKAVSWTGADSISGDNVWTDGANVYYSNGYTQLRLNGTSWEEMDWGIDPFHGSCIWKLGTSVYLSEYDLQYRLNGTSWEEVSWNGLGSFDGGYVWIRGNTAYYSHRGSASTKFKDYKQYRLNGDTWESVTWDEGGCWNISGNMVWSDGKSTYCSYASMLSTINDQCEFDGSSKWAEITWGGVDDFDIYASCVSKRNMSVYDYKHRAIGESMNYASDSADEPYGNGQYYTEDE